MASTWIWIIKKGDEEILRLPIPEGESFVGRGEDCQFILPDDGISRCHLKLRRKSDAITVENVSSFGDLKVNGEAREHVQLHVNDVISFADYSAHIEEGEDVAIASPSEFDHESKQENSGIALESPPRDELGNLEMPPDLEPSRSSDFHSHPVSSTGSLAHSPQEEIFPSEAFDEGDFGGRTQVQSRMMMGKLVITAGPDQGKEFPIERDEIFIGRAPSCDVALNDEGLSRKHFKIARSGSTYRVVDLESSNGTRVNGVRVIEQTLKSFDSITVGESELKFLVVHREWNQQDPPTMPEAAAAPGAGAVIRHDGLEPVPEGMFTNLIEDRGTTHAAGGPPETPSGWKGVTWKSRRWWEARSKPQRLLLFTALLLCVLIPVSYLTTPPAEKAVVETTPVLPNNLNKDIPEAFFALSEEERIDIERRYNAAVTAYQQKNWIEVTREANAIKVKIPYYKELDLILAEAQKELTKLDREKFDKIAADEDAEKPGDIYFYLEEGDAYLRQGAFDQAYDNYRKALELDPDNEEAKKGMRAAEARQQDKDWESKEVARKEREDQAVTEVVNRGRMLVEAQNFEEGITVLESALKMSVHNAAIHAAARKWIDYAIAARREKFRPDLVEAEALLQQRRYLEAYQLCETVLRAVQDFKEARECMNVAVERMQGESRKMYRRALIDEYLGNHRKAKQDYERIIQSFPGTDLYHQRASKKLKRYDPED